MKFYYVSFFALSLMTVGIARADMASDRFVCYRGFDAYPVRTDESKLKNPLFIVPVTENFYVDPKDSTKTTEEFLYLNEKGLLSATTSGVSQEAKVMDLQQSRVDALSVEPPGERFKVEDLFLTHLDQLRKDDATYVVPSKQDCNTPKNMKTVCALVIKHPTVINKKLDMDLSMELRNAIVRKAEGNKIEIEKQFGVTGPTLTDLDVKPKSELPAILKDYQRSDNDLDRCASAFPGDPTIQDAVRKQKIFVIRLIADRINHDLKGVQTSGQPPASSEAGTPLH